MAKVRLGINGFGRIGRCTFKQLIDDERFEIAGVNDLSEVSDMAYLLKYDSVHGWYPKKVADRNGNLVVEDQEVPFFSEENPQKIPWGDVGAEIVIESTGAFRSRDDAAMHIEAGAEKVIISAPSDDADATFVYGVNEDTYDAASHDVVSAASCTTNCLAPVAKVLLDEFGVEYLMLTTVHAYTSSQPLVDTPTRKRRRGRAAALSIVPTTTGATKATGLAIPELEGRMDGMAMRVPVPDGSVSDIVAHLETEVTAQQVNQAMERAADSDRLKGVLRVTHEALVSRDIVGDPHSSIVDAESTIVLRDRVVKVISWYDNEWGYSARLVDLAAFMSTQES